MQLNIFDILEPKLFDTEEDMIIDYFTRHIVCQGMHVGVQTLCPFSPENKDKIYKSKGFYLYESKRYCRKEHKQGKETDSKCILLNEYKHLVDKYFKNKE